MIPLSYQQSSSQNSTVVKPSSIAATRRFGRKSAPAASSINYEREERSVMLKGSAWEDDDSDGLLVEDNVSKRRRLNMKSESSNKQRAMKDITNKRQLNPKEMLLGMDTEICYICQKLDSH